MKKRSKFYLFIMIIFVCILTIGYGAVTFTDTLTINNKINISSSAWNLFFKNVVNENDNITDVSIMSLENTKTKLSITGEVLNKGDKYEILTDVINGGKYDAMVSEISIEGLNNYQEGSIGISLTYEDDLPVETNDLLLKNTNDKYKVTIEYLADGETLSEADSNFEITVSVTYVEKGVPGKDHSKNLTKRAQVGDIIKITPSVQSVELLTTRTGAEENQTFSLQDFDLFKVVDVKEDGTIVVVSNYTTRNNLTLVGETGLFNYVDILNEIASKFEGEKTVSSRSIGYKTQDAITSSVDADNVFNTEDTTLISTSLGDLKALRKDKFPNPYFIASRYYDSETEKYGIRYVDTDGVITQAELNENGSISAGCKVMLVLKKDLIVTGDGTEAKPYE